MNEELKLPEPAVMCDCGGDYYTADQLKAAVLAERERCARLCESLHSLPRIKGRGDVPIGPNSYSGKDVDAYDETASRIAAAIRAGAKEGQ